MVLIEEGKSKSQQHAEALLAARQSCKDGKDLHLFTDSWGVANGIEIWSGKWRLTEWKINGKDVWSKEAWMEIAQISKDIRVKVYHVDAH